MHLSNSMNRLPNIFTKHCQQINGMDITCWRWTEHCFACQKYKVFWNISAFGTIPRGDDRPMARVSQMFDPLNRVSIDSIISPKSVGERELAARHFFKLTVGDLILLDRGYPAYWLFNLIMSMGADFCARVSATKWKIIRKFVNSRKTRSDHLAACFYLINRKMQRNWALKSAH